MAEVPFVEVYVCVGSSGSWKNTARMYWFLPHREGGRTEEDRLLDHAVPLESGWDAYNPKTGHYRWARVLLPRGTVLRVFAHSSYGGRRTDVVRGYCVVTGNPEDAIDVGYGLRAEGVREITEEDLEGLPEPSREEYLEEARRDKYFKYFNKLNKRVAILVRRGLLPTVKVGEPYVNGEIEVFVLEVGGGGEEAE
ncbi:MAG: hypothetical protein DRO06_03135 [Thermoproteota archaeon]|nr:MAG: hypothetical protein DRO06_03135 [Candidatus Korarchaeota archaeon]